MKTDTRSLFTGFSKKQLFTFLSLLFSLFVLNAYSQDAPDQTKLGIRGGIVAGIDAAQVDGDDYAGYHKVGFNGGFYGQIPISKIFFASMEILYVQDGGKSPTYPGQVLAFSSQFSYAQVPAIFHYQGKEAFNVGVGFEYGRLVSQKVFVDQIEQPKYPVFSNKPTNYELDSAGVILLRRDWRVVADANYQFTKNFMVNVRFSYSLVPFGYNLGSNFINRGLYHNVLTFRLMYVFGG